MPRTRTMKGPDGQTLYIIERTDEEDATDELDECLKGSRSKFEDPAFESRVRDTFRSTYLRAMGGQR